MTNKEIKEEKQLEKIYDYIIENKILDIEDVYKFAINNKLSVIFENENYFNGFEALLKNLREINLINKYIEIEKNINELK